jgi:hypothetical protein
MPKLVPFPDYAPDISPLGQAESQVVFNVVPKGDGYGPVQSLLPYTDSLPSPCRGYFYGRRVDGSISIFAGTETDLYMMNNTTLAWDKVSKGGTPYAAVPVGDNWVFVQFNDLIIACQQNVPPQKYALSTASVFVDLAGDPPFAGSVAVVGFFVVMTALQENKLRAHWSDLDAPEQWTAGIGLSDFQDFPDGGITLAASGGDAFGVIFQEQSMRSMTYAPGSPSIFQFYRISTQEVLYAKHSIVNVGNRLYWLGAAGFKEMVGATSDPVPIGKEKIDRTFFAEVDAAAPNLILGASAPSSTRIYVAYKTKLEGKPGLFDRVLVYDYVLKKWARVNISGEFLASLAKPGLTLEAMDQFAVPQLMVEDAQDNGAGVIRLTLDAVYKPTFDLAAQPFATVQGVKGTTEANGVWSFNIIDDTHADLVGSLFVNAYIEGGAIGGSIEDIPFSFDSVIKAAIAQLSAFDADHRMGFFSGPNMEATLETGEADGEGKFLFTDSVMPITDATQVFCSIGWRNSPQALPTYTEENLIDEQGQAGIDPIESRYQRVRIRIDEGTFWTYARGVQPFTQPAGER